jgi:hypothetical protein
VKRLPIAALALALVTSSASADILSKQEQAYIAISVSTFVVASVCDGATVVENGLGVIADRNGIETDTLNKAIVAALNTQMNAPYERDDLVPAVTRLVAEVAHSMDAEMTSVNWSS